MKEIFVLSMSLLFAVQTIPAQAADDIGFLKKLGGVITNSSNGKTTISFDGGVEVTLTGDTMATTDANGNVFTTNRNSQVLAVNVPGKGMITYADQVDVASVLKPMR